MLRCSLTADTSSTSITSWPGNAGRLQGELYDIESDPLETSNLWNHPGHAEIKTRLMGRMLNWMMEDELRTSGSRGGERFRQSVMIE